MKTTNNNTQTNEEKIAKINSDKEIFLANLEAEKEKMNKKDYYILWQELWEYHSCCILECML